MNVVVMPEQGVPGVKQTARAQPPIWPYIDEYLMAAILGLIGLGAVMVASAAMGLSDHQSGDMFYYFKRHILSIGLGLFLCYGVLKVRLDTWQRLGPWLLGVAMLMLVLVLVPGIGHRVNGAARWITIGPLNIQSSEVAKLASIIYLSGYLVRRTDLVRESVRGFAMPGLVMGLLVVLCLMEPDFGASAVMMATALGLLFLAGARLWQFGIVMGGSFAAFAFLAVTSPYRLARLTGFLNPWEDPFNKGFQLTQALIAIGRGEWSGVGFGASIQKLFYLPEAHTDFLFSVYAEELGLVGVVALIAIYGFLVWRTFRIAAQAHQAGKHFGGYLAYGIGLWVGLQAFINLGVNMGILPTKGLTLPLMSYGRSSMIVMMIAMALLLRIDYEVRVAVSGALRKKRVGTTA